LLIKDFYWANRAEFDYRSLTDNGKRSPRRGWVRHDEAAGRRWEPEPPSPSTAEKPGPQRNESRRTILTHPGGLKAHGMFSRK